MMQKWFLRTTYETEDGPSRTQESLKIFGDQVSLNDVLDSVYSSVIEGKRPGETLVKYELERSKD